MRYKTHTLKKSRVCVCLFFFVCGKNGRQWVREQTGNLLLLLFFNVFFARSLDDHERSVPGCISLEIIKSSSKPPPRRLVDHEHFLPKNKTWTNKKKHAMSSKTRIPAEHGVRRTGAATRLMRLGSAQRLHAAPALFLIAISL
jgi:hypothetical protein